MKLKTNIYAIIILLFVVFSCSYPSPEERAIKMKHKRIQNSIRTNNGNLFLKFIDEDTYLYFEKILKASKDLSDDDVKRLKASSHHPLIDLLYIYSCREFFSKEQLDKFELNEFIIELLNFGAFNQLLSTEIVELNYAQHDVGITNINTRINDKVFITGKLLYNLENEKWKIDYTSKLDLSNKLIRIFCKNNMDEYEFSSCLKLYAKEYSDIELNIE